MLLSCIRQTPGEGGGFQIVCFSVISERGLPAQTDQLEADCKHCAVIIAYEVLSSELQAEIFGPAFSV